MWVARDLASKDRYPLPTVLAEYASSVGQAIVRGQAQRGGRAEHVHDTSEGSREQAALFIAAGREGLDLDADERVFGVAPGGSKECSTGSHPSATAPSQARGAPGSATANSRGPVWNGSCSAR